MKYDKYFLLKFKLVGIILGSFLLSVILHNVFYAIFGFEEPVFFLLATIVIPLYLLVCIGYTIYRLFTTKSKKK